MVSISEIIAAMKENGGWIDRSKDVIYKDELIIKENMMYEYVARGSSGKPYDVFSEPDQYTRIPSFDPRYFCKCVIKKHNILVDKLSDYGILKYMETSYPLFCDDIYKMYCDPEIRNFVDQACRLLEDMDINVDEVYECGFELIKKWCVANGIKYIDDYVPFS